MGPDVDRQSLSREGSPACWTEIPPAGGSLRLGLGELWAYRELLYFFVWRDVKVRYKQTAIGVGWAVIQPFLMMVVFALFFGRLAGLSTEGHPKALFYLAALVPWTYFANALGQATQSVVENQRVITKVYFPRLTLPISAVLNGLPDLFLSFLVLVGLLLHYRVPPTAALAALPALVLLAMATALAVGLWLSALNAIYRDVRYTVPFLIQLWLFASPIAYSSRVVPEEWRTLYGLNPMAGVVEGFRWALLGGQSEVPELLWASTGVVLLLLAGGLAFFRRMERGFADVV
ncbi:MAG: ABC transporter permease [Planctomycetes bacterium]|nr:ABC transporter permease [Planctomycetota bacterium]